MMRWRRVFVTLLAGLAAGCAGQTPRLLRPVRMPAIAYHYSVPATGAEERITITRLGEIQAASSERGTAWGQLTDEQIDDLLRAFAGWDRLSETYPSQPGGAFHVLSFGGKAVTGGPLAGAPDEFRVPVATVHHAAEGLRWRR